MPTSSAVRHRSRPAIAIAAVVATAYLVGACANAARAQTPVRPAYGLPPVFASGESLPARQAVRPNSSEREHWPEKVLYAFNGPDGASPNPVIVGPHGVLYGTTYSGGAYLSQCYAVGCGTVFQLTPPPKGQSTWTETVLYSFTGGADGGYPSARLTLGAHGVLYGTTAGGGTGNFGTVFALTPPLPGQTNWTESVLYSFTGGADGGYPSAALTDLRGALYSTASSFGSLGAGVAFRLGPPARGQTTWTQTVIHTFGGTGDGAAPFAGFTLAGNALLSTTFGGGSCHPISFGCGTVYELTPKGAGDRQWRETILFDFTGFDGLWPYYEPVLDASGALYVTAGGGGGGCGGLGCGTVVKLTPPLTRRRTWDSRVIFYNALTKSSPAEAVLTDDRGNLYGEGGGGPSGDGFIFELSPHGGGLYKETILHRFSGANGASPYGDWAIGPKGNIYGVTSVGGTACACGVIYQLNP
ncbi:MAG: hypothetical protein JO060_11565 [Candidatus Eremiobacteraeota bacterium]|nr:hypothetical protein [Candidatus Eremiobacteraeota bacterium]MBV9647935.1 hypothetical protein [Candidatus Eremiobacteraeota bacterium]